MAEVERPLTSQQLSILSVAESPTRAAAIARRAGVKAEVVYPALARLRARGLLRSRRSGPRAILYEITDRGRRLLVATRAFLEKA